MSRVLPIGEHALVALTSDLPEHGLRAGDVGTIVVHVYPEGKGFEVEVLNVSGQTVAVASVPATSLRPVRSDERPIPHFSAAV